MPLVRESHLSSPPVSFVQVVDELSDDETPQRLQEYGIRMVTPPERLGVTYNWNLVRSAAGSHLAYRHLTAVLLTKACLCKGKLHPGDQHVGSVSMLRIIQDVRVWCAGIPHVAGDGARVAILRQQRRAGAGRRD